MKEGLLIEGLQDWINLSDVHQAFAFDGRNPKRSAAEAQKLTLAKIRELVQERLFILGVPDETEPSGFKPWNLPLDDAMA